MVITSVAFIGSLVSSTLFAVFEVVDVDYVAFAFSFAYFHLVSVVMFVTSVSP